ncbi:inactive tyrosine-protein kinase PEAK1 isoform X2 [Narcine bancroftii]|uniref:inactive tyrosine-protein kinase PEAK1 isoform X2 n=1 Tax=Narcine bancroftii TaxID=1343680 RepID=UPI003831EEEF
MAVSSVEQRSCLHWCGERFAFRMSATSSEADSSSTCSQEHISISNDFDIFCTEGSMSSIDSGSKIYVNLAEVHASTARTKTLGNSSEVSMACQQKESVKESPKDSQPPPLPKKTLNRTNSAPGGALLGSSSTKSLPCSPGFQINNPLYGIYEGKSMFWPKTSFSTPCSPLNTNENFNLSSPFNRRPGMVKAQSLEEVTNYLPQLDMEKLNFQMSDLDLRNWINFENQADIFRKLACRSVKSLKLICTKYTRIFVESKKSALKFSESDWPDFKLPLDKICCHSRDAIYYRAQYIQEPQDEFTLKISRTLKQECLEMEREGLLIQESLPVHFNVQQVRGHFVAAIPTNLVHTEDAVPHTSASEIKMSNDESSAGAEGAETQPERNVNKSHHLVIITQETPYQTMADFVSKSTLLHKSEPDAYERQISLLLLQLCLGLEHLKGQGVTHCDLRLENLLLVKMSDPGSQAQGGHLQLPKLIISNFSKTKQKSAAIDQRFHPDHARLAPEMMSTSQYKMVDEFQLGILIYEILHMSNPFETILRQSEGEEYNPSNLPPIPQLSAYSEGLQHLAHLLLRADPSKRIHIRQAKGILQALLWGPCSKVFSVNTGLKDPPHALKKWLDVKHILLMLKFGEWFLDDQSSVTLEDWLCCQYFAYATPESVFQAVEELQILLE